MRRVIISCSLALFLTLNATGNCYSPRLDWNQYQPTVSEREKEINALYTKLSLLKDELKLEYKNEQDLKETCQIIVDRMKDEEIFSKYDVATVVTKESRFNKYALNKRDGGKGLGQITGLNKGWHDDIVPRNINPYNKRHAVDFIVKRLNRNYEMYGNKKKLAIQRYNGTSAASRKYLDDFYRVKNIIKTAKK